MVWQFSYVSGPPSRDDDRQAEVLVQIRRNSDGKIVEMRDQLYWPEDDDMPSWSNWEYGNYLCDCNRAMFFGDSTIGDDHVCSRGKYSVNLINPVCGTVVYEEF